MSTPKPRSKAPKPHTQQQFHGTDDSVQSDKRFPWQQNSHGWIVDIVQGENYVPRILIIDQRQIITINFQTGQVTFASLIRNLVAIKSTAVSQLLLSFEFSTIQSMKDLEQFADNKQEVVKVGNKRMILKIGSQSNRDTILAILFTHRQASQLDRAPLQEACSLLSRLKVLERPVNAIFKLSKVSSRTATSSRTRVLDHTVGAIGMFYPKVFHFEYENSVSNTAQQTQPTRKMKGKWQFVYDFSLVQRVHVGPVSSGNTMHICLGDQSIWSYCLSEVDQDPMTCIIMFLGWMALNKSEQLNQNKRIQPYIDVENNSLFTELGLLPSRTNAESSEQDDSFTSGEW